MTAHLLFVDDDPRLLQGIERTLRPMRDRWTPVCVDAGPEALAWLERLGVAGRLAEWRALAARLPLLPEAGA